MAKSKNGGSRAFIRGRIGSDVYSVGKNGSGQRQQVVRSLAVQVSNPRTSSQMFGRMVMSTVMQAVSAFAPVIDHSFDGVAKGQPSISEFIRRNYQLIKADAIANPSSGQHFDLVKYQEKHVQGGDYVISDGQAPAPVGFTQTDEELQIALTAETLTVGGLKAKFAQFDGGFLTAIWVDGETGAHYIRIKVTTDLADDTAITSQNVGSLFSLESNTACIAILSTNTIKIYPTGSMYHAAYGLISSVPENGGWKHSYCKLTNGGTQYRTADLILPTYPVGEDQFLNGGEL